MTMIEKVARALRSGRGCGYEFPCPFCNWGPDERTPQWDETGCIWLARAAIEAMREPSEKMLDDGAYGSGEDTHGTARGAWRAMIDAALADEKAPA